MMSSDHSKDFNFSDDSPPISFSTWSAVINNETEASDQTAVNPINSGTEVQLSLFEEESDFFKVVLELKTQIG